MTYDITAQPRDSVFILIKSTRMTNKLQIISFSFEMSINFFLIFIKALFMQWHQVKCNSEGF